MTSSCWRFLDCELGKHCGCSKFFCWKSRSVQQYHPGGQAEYFWLPRQDNCRNIVLVVVVVKGGKVSEEFIFLVIKFSFPEKATKICAICLMIWRLLCKYQNRKADCANFSGLLRKSDLYLRITEPNCCCLSPWNLKFGRPFSTFLFDCFLLPKFTRVFCLYKIKLFLNWEKYFKRLKLQIHLLGVPAKGEDTFWDFAAFIVLSFVYLLTYFVESFLSSLSIQWRKV